MTYQKHMPTSHVRLLILSGIMVLLCFLPILCVRPVQANTQNLDQNGTLWAPYLEWTLTNPTYSGNPFDLVATATFVHPTSNETRKTPMFYAGNNAWRFRFTATRTGTWTVTTSSTDPELNGHQGTITITPNPDPEIKGFITTFGNKFARQIGENGELEAYLYNVYQDNESYPADFVDISYIQNYPPDKWVREYLAMAREHGANTLFIAPAHQWLELGTLSVDDHDKVDPDLTTFAIIEQVITAAHREGGHVQLWMWGDNAVSRRWTPIGLPGGINGEVDQRLQRYIAARLGPLPGWTMGYGFDLEEWVSEEELATWAGFLHGQFGWQHLLWARNRQNSELDVVSYNAILGNDGPESYADVVAKLNSDPDRPHLEEERFYHQRYGKYDMETTRRHFWWYAMAGGMGGHWGYHPRYSNERYPNPEQLAAHRQFWDGRFLLDMAPANTLSDGYVLKDAANMHYVFYKEDTDSVRMDLSGMDGSRPAVAIDTKKAYAEIDLGLRSAGDQTWEAPYASDWAIAVGTFADPADPGASDTTAPRITSASIAREDRSKVRVNFSEPVDPASATMIDNYQINNEVDVIATALSDDGRQVTLTTSQHRPDVEYVLTVNGVQDRASPANTIASDTQVVYQILGHENFLPIVLTSLVAATTVGVAGSVWFWWHRKHHPYNAMPSIHL